MTTTQTKHTTKQILYNNKPLNNAQKMTLLLTGSLPSCGSDSAFAGAHNAGARTSGAGGGIIIGNKLDKSSINIVSKLLVSEFKKKQGRRMGCRVVTRVWRKGRVNTLNRLRKKLGKPLI